MPDNLCYMHPLRLKGHLSLSLGLSDWLVGEYFEVVKKQPSGPFWEVNASYSLKHNMGPLNSCVLNYVPSQRLQNSRGRENSHLSPNSILFILQTYNEEVGIWQW